MTTTFVFIDSRVADYQTLVAGFVAGTEWYLINADEDGVEQMARALSGRSGLDSIQIVSHGSIGSMLLGAAAIDAQSLATYADQLAQMGAALTASGDILLYGCNVAQGDVGQQFIGGLALATGADVAASTDVTGTARLGGNWTLESATGRIEATELKANIAGLLAVTPGQSLIDLGSYGKLIAPVNFGGNFYYYWDRSGDGTSAGADTTTHPVLDGIFNKDINGNTGGGGDTTDIYRYATLNDVRLALPKVGPMSRAVGLPQYGNPTNTTYDDLLAIWDRYNGTGINDTLKQGTPPGWALGTYLSSTPAPWPSSVGNHLVVGFTTGYVDAASEGIFSGYVALQVLDSTAPVFSSGNSASIAENTIIGTTVYDATADSDSGVTYTIGGADASLFNINASSGEVTFKTSPNYEIPTDVGSNNAYDITVRATDTVGNATDQVVTITVTNVNEAPSFFALNGTPTYIENGTVAVLDSDVQIADTELVAVGYYGDASLSLARDGGTNAQDVFSNSGSLGALAQGGNLTVEGTVIGTVTTNSGGTLTLTFNGSATQGLVNSAMQQIAYSNSSDAPPASVHMYPSGRRHL
jgi:hypothetical protein